VFSSITDPLNTK